MKTLLEQKGIIMQDFDVEVVYYSEDMLSKNVIITEESYFDQEDRYQTLIGIMHYNDIDAWEKTIYHDLHLSQIQLYRILMDILKIYREFPFHVFALMIDELSEESISASMQSDPLKKIEVMNRIKDKICEYKS